MSSNIHIKNFLDTYIQKMQKPDYAVLITGNWGCGKTFFIKNYLGVEKKEVRDYLTGSLQHIVVYVSLFGVKKKEQIDELILKILHPYLDPQKIDKTFDNATYVSSVVGGALGGLFVALETGSPSLGYAGAKTVKKTAKKIGGALKGWVKDFANFLVKQDGTPKKLVLVFDDVERADMPLPELLGYINVYVEHLHLPCVLLADHDEWKKACECQKNESTLYMLTNTQEKIIGKTFKLRTSFDDVWNCWTQNDFPGGSDVKDVVLSSKDDIKRIVEKFGPCNYRSLKHCFFDFQLFLNKIKKEYKAKKDFNKLLVADFFSHQYAFHMGKLNPKDIVIYDEWEEAFLKEESKDKKNEELSSFEKFQSKTEKERMLSNFVDRSYANKWQMLWKQWLLTTYVDRDDVNSLIENSIWFKEKVNSDLLNVVYWRDLDDKSAEAAYFALSDLSDKTLKNPHAIMNIYFFTMWYIKQGYFSENKTSFTRRMKTYVNGLSELDSVPFCYWNYGPQVQMYKENEEDNEKFRNFLQGKQNKQFELQENDRIKAFLDGIGEESEESFERVRNLLVQGLPRERLFSFVKMPVEDFLDKYISLSSMGTQKMCIILKDRYEYTPQKRMSEKDYLEKIKVEATSKMKIKNGDKYLLPGNARLSWLIKTIEDILA